MAVKRQYVMYDIRWKGAIKTALDISKTVPGVDEKVKDNIWNSINVGSSFWDSARNRAEDAVLDEGVIDGR